MRPGSRMVPRRRRNHRNHGTHPHRPRRLRWPRCRRRSPEWRLGLWQRQCLELRLVGRCRQRPRRHPSPLSSGNQWFPRVRRRLERRHPLRRQPPRLWHPRPPRGRPRTQPPPPAPPLTVAAALVSAPPPPATPHPTAVPTTSIISPASLTSLVMRRPR